MIHIAHPAKGTKKWEKGKSKDIWKFDLIYTIALLSLSNLVEFGFKR